MEKPCNAFSMGVRSWTVRTIEKGRGVETFLCSPKGESLELGELRRLLVQHEVSTGRSTFVHLLEEAKSAIISDLAAVGEEEIAQHPTLQARSKLVDRIEEAIRVP